MSEDPKLDGPDTTGREEIDKELINVLIVDDDERMRELLANLLKKLDISEDNIHLAENTAEAKDILIKLKDDVRKRINLLFSDIRVPAEEDGIEFIRWVHSEESEENRPYTVAVSGFGVVEDLVGTADAFLNKSDIAEKLNGVVIEFIKNQRKKEALILAQQAEAEAEVGPDEIPSPESLLKKKTEYKKIDLARGMRKQTIALFDLDGTLSRHFTMHRWVKYLHECKIGDERLREKLLQILIDYDEGNYSKGYYPFIRESGELYGEMLTGLKTGPIAEMGKEWSLKDAPMHIMKYGPALIRLLKGIGTIPTIVTGTPIEALPGARHFLGVQDRCYALEPDHVDGVYTGMIKYNTGLPDVKSGLVQKMAENGHQILFGMGNQGSDSPLIKGALEIQSRQHDIRGTGVIVDPPDSIWREYQSHHADAIRDLRLIRLLSSTETNAFLTAVYDLIQKAVMDDSNKGIRNIKILRKKTRECNVPSLI